MSYIDDLLPNDRLKVDFNDDEFHKHKEKLFKYINEIIKEQQSLKKVSNISKMDMELLDNAMVKNIFTACSISFPKPVRFNRFILDLCFLAVGISIRKYSDILIWGKLWESATKAPYINLKPKHNYYYSVPFSYAAILYSKNQENQKTLFKHIISIASRYYEKNKTVNKEYLSPLMEFLDQIQPYISENMARIMIKLVKDPELVNYELAEQLQLNNSTISTLLNILERKRVFRNKLRLNHKKVKLYTRIVHLSFKKDIQVPPKLPGLTTSNPWYYSSFFSHRNFIITFTLPKSSDALHGFEKWKQICKKQFNFIKNIKTYTEESNIKLQVVDFTRFDFNFQLFRYNTIKPLHPESEFKAMSLVDNTSDISINLTKRHLKIIKDKIESNFAASGLNITRKRLNIGMKDLYVKLEEIDQSNILISQSALFPYHCYRTCVLIIPLKKDVVVSNYQHNILSSITFLPLMWVSKFTSPLPTIVGFASLPTNSYNLILSELRDILPFNSSIIELSKYQLPVNSWKIPIHRWSESKQNWIFHEDDFN